MWSGNACSVGLGCVLSCNLLCGVSNECLLLLKVAGSHSILRYIDHSCLMHHKLLHLMMMKQLLALPARLKKCRLAQLILQRLLPARCLLTSRWLFACCRIRLLRVRDVQSSATEVLARHALADDALLLLILMILLLEPT